MTTVAQPVQPRTAPRKADPPEAPPRRRRAKRILAVAGGAILLFWLLPAIVAHSFLLNWIVGTATADLEGEVRVGSASLGWFSPVVLQDVSWRDAEQQPLATIGTLSGDRALAGMLWDASRLGTFRIEGAQLNLALRPDGSNLEDALAALLEPSDEPSTPIDLSVEVKDGTASIVDARNGRQWTIDGLDLAFTMSSRADRPMALECSAGTSDAQGAGNVQLSLKLGAGPSDAESRSEEGGDVALKTENFPLDLVEAVLARVDAKAELAGRLDCDLHCRWSGTEAIEGASVEGRVSASALALAGPWLGGDRLALDRLTTDVGAAWHGDTLRVDKASVECDAGSVSMAGRLDLSEQAMKDWLASAGNQTIEVNGRLDLARLARLLPETLHIEEGTEITSGQVEIALAGRPGPNGKTWLARVSTSDLAAVNRGRRLVWQQPVEIHLAARQTDAGPVVDRLECDSSFLRMEGFGTADHLTATAHFDLDRLAEQLAGFVDLGEVRMAGSGSASLVWKRPEGSGFETESTFRTRELVLVLPAYGVELREDVAARLDLTGATDLKEEYRLATASLIVQAGGDRLDVVLMEPVADFMKREAWPLDVTVQGELSGWLPRIRPWIALDDWNPAGKYVLTAQGVGSAKAIEVRQARLSVEKLRVSGNGLNVFEPEVNVVASGRWDQESGRLDLKRAALTAGQLAVQAENVVLAPAEEGRAGMSGTLGFRGTLDQVQNWIDFGTKVPPWRMSGDFSGGGQIQKDGATSGGAIDAFVTNLVYTAESGTRFSQRQLRLAAAGSYDAASGVLSLRGAQIAGDGVDCRGAGQMVAAEGSTDLKLAGTLDYDMDRLVGLLQPYLGPGFFVTGRGSQPFGYEGTLDPATAEGRAGLGWESIYAYGFRGGPATLSATLSRGVVELEPIEMDLNEGKLNLGAAIRVAPGPMELQVQKNSAARQLRIDPSMCAGALKYIAPILADVAAAQGKFSIELDECRLPLADPGRGEMKGRFILHSVEVGPGPLVRELAILLGRAAPARLQRESVVPFQLADGRVYHQGLELIFPELTVRMHGSVGMDQTVLLMAEMPVPPKWAALNPRVAAAMKDQVVRLPINGTLQHPQIDRRAMEQYTRQFVRKAAENLIQDELNRQFDRLFGPRD